MNELDLQSTILLVDDEPANIKALAATLGSQHRILAATSGEQAMDIIYNRPDDLDLILLDVLMPGISGYEVTARLRSNPETRAIPIIFITARNSPNDEARGLEIGAVDFIGKPFHPDIVRARVHTQLELKKHKDHLDDLVSARTLELINTRRDIVLRLAKAAETRDNETGMHIIRLSHLCEILGRAYGLSPAHVENLTTASLMHDIGKIGIPDSVLLKPGKHNAEERKIMQTHALLGGEILAGGDNELLVMAQAIALTHHERWDGSGYPRGLAGESIPLEGRITSVCDVFDALTSHRPYKQPWSVEEAIHFLQENSGTMFDPKLVDLFLSQLDQVRRVITEYADPHPEPSLCTV